MARPGPAYKFFRLIPGHQAAKGSLRQWEQSEFRPSADGKSQKEIARSLGISAAYLSQIRHGVRPMSVKIKQKISKTSGISVNDFTMVGHSVQYAELLNLLLV
jgi:hypothetical protein